MRLNVGGTCFTLAVQGSVCTWCIKCPLDVIVQKETRTPGCRSSVSHPETRRRATFRELCRVSERLHEISGGESKDQSKDPPQEYLSGVKHMKQPIRFEPRQPVAWIQQFNSTPRERASFLQAALGVGWGFAGLGVRQMRLNDSGPFKGKPKGGRVTKGGTVELTCWHKKVQTACVPPKWSSQKVNQVHEPMD